MSSHTPLPWKVADIRMKGGDQYITDSSGRTLAVIGAFITDRRNPVPDSEITANAAVMGASGDLLLALKAMRDAFADHPDGCLHCNWGDGATGRNQDGTPCGLCAPQREALARADLAIATAQGQS